MYQEREDFFGNRVAYFAVQEPHSRLDVVATSQVTLFGASWPDAGASRSWEEVGQLLAAATQADLREVRQFVLDSPLVTANPECAEYAAPSFGPGRPVLDAMQDLNQRIYHDLSYDPHFTTVATPVHDVLLHRRGVCQDYAQLAIACVRSMGLAARYVSGYLETVPPPGQTDQAVQPEAVEAIPLVGAAASHAWLSVYSPGQGWVDFDPTNNMMPMDQHITLAWGRDYNDVTPLKGVAFGGGTHNLEVAVEVRRIELARKGITTHEGRMRKFSD